MCTPTGEIFWAQRTEVSELEAHSKKLDLVSAEIFQEQVVQRIAEIKTTTQRYHSTAPKKASIPSVPPDNDASSHNGYTSKGNGSAARTANLGHFLHAGSRTEEEDTLGLHRGGLHRCTGAKPGAASEAVQTPGLPEKEVTARPAGAGGSLSVNDAAKAAIAALRNATMVMDDQVSLAGKIGAQAQKLTPAAPRELIKCLVGLCDKYGLEVEATGLRLAARHATKNRILEVEPLLRNRHMYPPPHRALLEVEPHGIFPMQRAQGFRTLERADR
jgi:hypothetical protein